MTENVNMSDPEYIRLPVCIESWNDQCIDYAEIERAEWNRMTPEQREEWAKEESAMLFVNRCNYGYDLDGVE
jgi:hypothetical protein